MTIEEIIYEAYELGVREELLNQVLKMKGKEKYRYTPLKDMYERALNKVKKRENITV